MQNSTFIMPVISIHAPRAGSDRQSEQERCASLRFQSTLPVRGATNGARQQKQDEQFQSTLPVRGATSDPQARSDPFLISIHAPRAGSDEHSRTARMKKRDFNPRSPCGERPQKSYRRSHLIRFQSTLPVRGATEIVDKAYRMMEISIHAPRAGSDHISGCRVRPDGYFNPRSPCGERRLPGMFPKSPRYFNPRSPCGERRQLVFITVSLKTFQSTLPVRGATSWHGWYKLPIFRFQSTLPVRGATCFCHSQRCRNRDFNPRSPCGERPAATEKSLTASLFQSTLPVRGATWSLHTYRLRCLHFNPRSPCGERLLRFAA